MSRSSEGQGHNDACLWKGDDLNNKVCEYEVNPLTNEKLLEENETLTPIVYEARRPPKEPDSTIYKSKFSLKNPAKNIIFLFKHLNMYSLTIQFRSKDSQADPQLKMNDSLYFLSYKYKSKVSQHFKYW